MGRHLLNRLLPMKLRTFLRTAAGEAIPSLRHLDMPKRLRHMRSLGFTPTQIFDGGAARGEWSAMAAELWPAADILGVDPRPANREPLEALKRRVPRFNYVQSLLGSEVRKVQFHDRGDQTSLCDDAPVDSNAEASSADMLTIDSLVESGRCRPPEFIKLDVQGYEAEVIAGATRSLSACQAMLLEVNFYKVHPAMRTVDELIVMLRDLGFAWYDVMGILRRPSDDTLGYMDLMFVRHDHPLRQSEPGEWFGSRVRRPG
jgi:FkbM family methyltransferase